MDFFVTYKMETLCLLAWSVFQGLYNVRAQKLAYAFPISVKSKPTLVENHGCQTCIALNHDWSLHNSDLCIGSLLFVAVTYGLYQGLVELVNVINGGLVLLGVVQQRMMGQVDPRYAGTPGVPKLGPSWLFSFVPSDLNSTMLPWSGKSKCMHHW